MRIGQTATDQFAQPIEFMALSRTNDIIQTVFGQSSFPKDAILHAREYQLYLPSEDGLQRKLIEWDGHELCGIRRIRDGKELCRAKVEWSEEGSRIKAISSTGAL